ncbi:hypothetical protein C6P40_000137 [Pichia californica]|uniref:alanine--glyoxylate transaminase n=1 Tax=Pichia californica TaxID=460514 RepID=A0A9P6WL85_9ASCO|nr:hypothetical protein C6P42_005253 [[Candida] californica]KAG0689110.1 hypothetical protein C6P40_000137 [[Candida] californica]
MSARKLTFIPGPIEFSDDVLAAMSTPSQAHTSPEFIKVFQSVLIKTRKLFNSSVDSKSQPFIISGSGTLGWDICGSNLLNPDDNVLVLSTGFFSDQLANCLKIYSNNIDILESPKFGSSIDLIEFESKLKLDKSYQMITITQTDTSSGVLNNIEKISKIIKLYQPNALIVVDAVCATACETLLFDSWGIDYVLTASQKAIGVPSGLSISIASERAIEKAFKKEKPNSFFADMKRWTPIMKAYEDGRGAYFATPAVQLIHALNVSLDELLINDSISENVKLHKIASDNFKDKLVNELGLTLVPISRDVAAHGLSVVYYPDGIVGSDLLTKMAENGFTIASGIYKDYKDKYFRVGHMGVAAIGARKIELDQCFEALKLSLSQLGYTN